MMSAFDALEVARRFLEDRLLPETPAHLRSELRATLKLLTEAEGEFDALPALLLADSIDLLDLAAEAEALLPAALGGKLSTARWRAEIAAPIGSLKELVALHDDIRAEAGQILLSLRHAADPRCDALTDRYVALAGRQAIARLPWQSVFN